MRTANVFFQNIYAGRLVEDQDQHQFRFTYEQVYDGAPISLTMPVRVEPYVYDAFPPFFDGLLPEGAQLEALLQQKKIDRGDPFEQLLAIGADMVGAVTVQSNS
jgi:serine/threonine-protein kinase HipA